VPSSKPVLGVNDLETRFPDIAAEAYGWDPSTVTAGSRQKKEWKCGKGHIFLSSIKSRTIGRTGCPVCSGKQVLAGFNDLQTRFPDIAAEAYGWDPSKIMPGTIQKKEWRCDKGHIYSSTVNSRTTGRTGCTFCSGKQVLAGFNDLKTKFPDIAAEAYGWDPSTVTAGSHQKKEWKCNKGHIYLSPILDRTTKRCGCPVCSGKQVLAGFNDLQTRFPDIAAEAYGWDPSTVVPGTEQVKEWKCGKGHIFLSSIKSRTTKRCGCTFCSGKQVLTGFNDLKKKFPGIAAEAYGWDPSTVTASSHQKKEWKCDKGHIYLAVISGRTSGNGCPVCSGRQVLAGFNDLKTKFPDIAAEAYGWDPSTVVPGTEQKKDWKCHKGHIYSSIVAGRTCNNRGCPVCSGMQVLAGFNDLQTRFPDVAEEAYGWDPSTVTAGSHQKLKWKCDQGHIYHSLVVDRTSGGNRCPFCSGRQLLAGFNDLQTRFPGIAAEAYGWDPSKIMPGTIQKKEWRCDKGHIYSSTVNSRTSIGTGCPVCAESGFNPEKDAWFYLMQRPGEQQFGITNVLSDRLRTHERNGWILVEHTTHPAPGQKVFNAEKVLKRWLKKEIGLIKGTTENWSTTKMEVQSLAELKARSGIETDLF
jgi:predicted methyltransferase